MIAAEALGAEALGIGPDEADYQGWLAGIAGDAGKIFTLEFDAYQTPSIELDETPLGCEALGSVALDQEGFATDIRNYHADRELITGADDDPPSLSFEPRLVQALRLDRLLPLSPLDGNRLAFSVGAAEIANGDGALDALGDTLPVDGKTARVRLGNRGQNYSTFRVVFNGLARALVPNRDRASLELTGIDYLTEALIQTDRYSGVGGVGGGAAATPPAGNSYAGGGGVAGDDEVAGLIKPRLFGACSNVSPPLIDRANNVFQVNDGAVSYTSAVYDRAAALTPGADYADYATLIAASPAGGSFITCNALGIFRVESLASNSVITADVLGDYRNGETAVRPGALCVSVMRDIMGIAPERIDAAAFAGLDVDLFRELGDPVFAVAIYVAAEMTLADFLDQVLRSVGAVWGDIDGSGRIGCLRLLPPEAADHVVDLAAEQLEPMQRLDPPDSVYPPWWRLKVGHAPNWTVQTGEDLAGSVTQERRQFLGQSFRPTAPSDDITVLARHARARDAGQIDTLLNDTAAAEAMRDHWLEMFGVDRRLYEAVNRREAWDFRLGQAVRVTYPRLNLTAPRVMRIVGLAYDARDRAVTMTLWG